MKLYPAIDLLGGKAVRLEEGRRDRATVFHDHPPELVATGTHSDHAAIIRRLRTISERLRQPLTILQDLQGPKIRVGDLIDGRLNLVPGQLLTLTTRSVPGDSGYVSVDFPELPRSVSPGGRVLLDMVTWNWR